MKVDRIGLHEVSQRTCEGRGVKGGSVKGGRGVKEEMGVKGLHEVSQRTSEGREGCERRSVKS